MFIRSAFNYDRDEVSRECGLQFTEEDYELCVVDPSKAEDADINVIVARFGITGTLPVVERPPLDVSFEEVFDFHSAMNAVRSAELGFQALPAELRLRFQNDPGQLLAFLDDPANREEAVKLGIVAPPAPPKETPGDPKGAGNQGDVKP